MWEKITPDELQGVYKEIAETMGVENAFKVYQILHGQVCTFPQHFLDSSYVAKICTQEHIQNGRSVKELARKYSYTERRVRQMISNSSLNQEEEKPKQ